MIDILRDPKTGSREVIHICYECDSDTYPRGKPILPTDIGAKKDDKTGQWVCSECQPEDINRMLLRTLGLQHPKCQAFIETEDKRVR